MTPASSHGSSGPRVAVVGAGVLGLTVAWRLAQAGARVLVHEAEPEVANASTVAAGMIAPVAECAFEPTLHEIAPDLRAARRLWGPVAADLGITLAPTGTCFVGDAGTLSRRRALLRELGFDAAASAAGDPDLFAPQDALVRPSQAMAALRAALVRAGGGVRHGRVEADGDGLAIAGEPLKADAVVLAVGAPGRTSRLAPELACLVPVKGQLVRWPGLQAPESMLRADAGFYLASTGAEMVAGATMEPGRDDLEPDATQLAGIVAQAVAIVPELLGRAPEIAVGVRAETPDGLPMVGPSSQAGVFLATGARRNGWLLAPLIAEMVTAQVLGLATPELAPLAQRLHPGRFEKRRFESGRFEKDVR